MYNVEDPNASGFFTPGGELRQQDSREGFLTPAPAKSVFGAQSRAPTRAVSGGDYGLGRKGDLRAGETYYTTEMGEFVSEMDPELGEPKHIITEQVTFGRRVWVGIVWALTFWIPSFMLRYIGRMKRPDVRFAWREKLVLVFIIFMINATIVFYIVAFGRLLCPNFDKVWDAKNVGTHQGDNDFYVSIHGSVYDISNFWKQDHGKGVTREVMEDLRGRNLDMYFVPPLTRSCPGLVTEKYINVLANDTSLYQWNPSAAHVSGDLQPDTTIGLHDETWYEKKFLPKMKKYYKGDLVIKREAVKAGGEEDPTHYWFVLDNVVYDLTHYFYTADLKDRKSVV